MVVICLSLKAFWTYLKHNDVFPTQPITSLSIERGHPKEQQDPSVGLEDFVNTQKIPYLPQVIQL